MLHEMRDEQNSKLNLIIKHEKSRIYAIFKRKSFDKNQ